ncbi:hypothetical protein Xen7305DRAFT_00036970 [Xenococcus sp. PCC 7305]|uniref:hypothetical protein n=1 Tax=Xenococcus sp. PCC 7305 TaxID=102125 RepID=UPI0002ACE7ED|nr:hypothetical protein [Xenococcus sp. PCC 7305]ELS03971.1 hypothetical protein Xen7305DRAFT_00036970 [Xenococcus sp. PCC 7305]
MSKQPLFKNLLRSLMASSIMLSSLIYPEIFSKPAFAVTNRFCQLPSEAVQKKEQLLQSSLQNNPQATQEYQSLIQEHRRIVTQCRQTAWPQEQAIWLRLYPCDASPGAIDHVLDRIVNLGYNRVNLEVFYNGQVLLPPADNPTPWVSTLNSPGMDNIDLLKQTIEKGHERGLKIYAWMFTMNFGYRYAERKDRQEALARNGTGENSLTFVRDHPQAFIDPYNRQAQQDYYHLLQTILRRKPDGVLFDYIRYPRGAGNQSLVSKVRDLWIYSPASLQALYNRATNQKAKALIDIYVRNGKITPGDLAQVDQLYPNEGEPNWQGRRMPNAQTKTSARDRFLRLQADLWFFSVAHAAQGVIDFLSFAASPVQQQQLAAGAVFFPDANRLVGNSGFDSRLQAWDKFPQDLEWHPMAYSVCDGTHCIIDEISQVLQAASEKTKVIPALAGVWGDEFREHPRLEVQMDALRKSLPELKSVSHFAYSWQEPEIDRQRKFCKVQ